MGSDRDRDEVGRARNARPRDALGRPLPYGTAGTARLPEGVPRAPEETIGIAQRLLDEGNAFQAHEVFEDAWKSADELSRGLWKGLAQLAVGVTHAARGNVVGGAALLRRGASTVEPFALLQPYGIAVTELRAWALQHASELDGLGQADGGVAVILPVPRLRSAPQPDGTAGLATEDIGGDPVCWLHLVCEECGTLNDSASAKRCHRCGAVLVATARDEGVD